MAKNQKLDAAENTASAAKETAAVPTVNFAVKKAVEPVYKAEEFARNAEQLFGRKANSDLTLAAFKLAGKQEATLSEAKEIVDNFVNKEVK